MTAVVWALVIVAAAVLSALFAVDSRPGVEQPPQGWFGRR